MIEVARIGRIKSDLLWLARSDLGHIRGLSSTARKADWASLVRFLSGSSGSCIARLDDDVAALVDPHRPDRQARLQDGPDGPADITFRKEEFRFGHVEHLQLRFPNRKPKRC
jgi:hypothetical protein